jgi:thiopeptide-type bacteriocin biosynthesis protein
MQKKSDYLSEMYSDADENETAAETWLYVRIYCQMSEADAVLTDLVAPLQERFYQEKLIRRCFFIRFFEGGHHLRVRFLAERAVFCESIRPIINQSIVDYFSQQGFALHDPLDRGPQGRDHVTWQPLMQAETVRPIPSYEYDRYIPERERYGGVHGLYISEQHFADSSAIALRVLQIEHAGKGSRRNAALMLLHALAEAFQLTTQQKAASFEEHYRYQFANAWQTPPDSRRMAQEYERQRSIIRLLVPLDAEIPLQRNRIIWLPLVLQWQAALDETVHQLMELQTHHALNKPLAAIMPSYVHMLCNRLGLYPREEAYLCYLLACHYSEHEEGGSRQSEEDYVESKK